MTKHFMAALAAAFLICATGASAQSDYPSRPITIIVPFGAGGVTATWAREVAERLRPRLGQPVVVENRPGQGGSLGAAYAAKQEPDGYTLFVGSNANTVGQTLYPDLPFNILTDFEPIAKGSDLVNVFVVNPSFAGKSIQDVIDMAKANPGKLKYGSSGYGGGYHMTMALFTYMADVDILHVPYRTASQALTDVVAGRMDMMITAYANAKGNIASGQVRVLGVTSPTSRFSELPDVPTIAESGVPGYDGNTWIGLLAPAGTPKPIIDRLHAAMMEIQAEADFRAKLAPLGCDITGEHTTEEFAAFMKKDLEKWRKVIKAAGISVKK